MPEIRQIKLLYREDVSRLEMIAAAVSAIGIVAVAPRRHRAHWTRGLHGLAAHQGDRIPHALGAKPVAVLAAVLRKFTWP